MQLRGVDIIEQDGVNAIAIKPDAGTVKMVGAEWCRCMSILSPKAFSLSLLLVATTARCSTTDQKLNCL